MAESVVIFSVKGSDYQTRNLCVCVQCDYVSALSDGTLLFLSHMCVFVLPGSYINCLCQPLSVFPPKKSSDAYHCYVLPSAFIPSLSHTHPLSFLLLFVPLHLHSPFIPSSYSYFIWLVRCDVVTAARQIGFPLCGAQ